MKTNVILTVLILLASTALAFEDTKENREKECERYLKATPPAEIMQNMAEKMAMNFPPEQRQEFKDVMTKHLDLRALTKAMKEGMVKHFTADELKALADFYETPVGKSAMAKMGDYSADVMPTIEAEVMKAMAKFQKAQAEKNRALPDIEGK